MILLDALYVNSAGGKVLLDSLITEFEKTELSVFYLLDKRIQGKHSVIKESNIVTYLVPNIVKRHKFYLNNQRKFDKILCFGNIPPNIRLDAVVYTYFHQKLFIKVPRYLNIKDKNLLRLKSWFLKKVVSNTDYWIVQTDVIKADLLGKYKINEKNVLVIPFYPTLTIDHNGVERKEDSFIYVSNAPYYKNHMRLLEAFKLFFIQERRGELHLTVNDSCPKVISRIKQLNLDGCPIINHGFQSREKLFSLYRSSKYCIFPSLEESFGLGIIESIESGCQLIAADLPYIHAICRPSLTFDPTDVMDIKNSFKVAIYSCLPPTTPLVRNQMDVLINLFKR